jgi:hypothetical protein
MGALFRAAASRERAFVLFGGHVGIGVGVAGGVVRRGWFSSLAARPGIAVAGAGEGSAAVGEAAGEVVPRRTVHRDIHRIGVGRRG